MRARIIMNAAVLAATVAGCTASFPPAAADEPPPPRQMPADEANRLSAAARDWHYPHNRLGESGVGNPVDHTYVWTTTTTDPPEAVLAYYQTRVDLPNLARLDDPGTMHVDSTGAGRPARRFDLGQQGFPRSPGDPPAVERVFGVRRDGYNVTCVVTPEPPGGKTRVVVVHDWIR